MLTNAKLPLLVFGWRSHLWRGLAGLLPSREELPCRDSLGHAHLRAHGAYQYSLCSSVLDDPSLFDLDQKIRVGIEDVLWAAAVGGIASVVAEILLKERLSVLRKGVRKRHFAPFVVVVVVFIVLQFWHPGKTICNTIIAFAIGALVIAYIRSDLIPTMFTGALSFALLYFALFLIFLFLYPGFIQRYYNIPNLLGIYVLGVPIEELLFAGAGGAIWSVAYEYVPPLNETLALY